jgi:hypothetical protein
MSAHLKQKVSRLENLMHQYSATVVLSECTCRGTGGSCGNTMYHTNDELEVILYVPCPVHGLRDPGPIWFRGRPYPLARPDWDYCTCPPHPWRDFVMGKRPRPTQEEIEQYSKEKRVLKRSFQEEKKRTEEILKTFWAKFNQSRGLNG